MYELTETIAWCVSGATEERPVDLRRLLACIDFRERIVATREELCHALGQLRAEGRVAGAGGRYFAPAADTGAAVFIEPTGEEYEAAVRAYVHPAK